MPSGIIEIKNDLEKLGKDFEKKANRAFKAGVIQMRNLAGESAPVDTGTLKSNVLSYPVETGEEGVYKIGSSLDYAIYVHDGTHKIQARPFLDYAVDSLSGELEAMVSRVLGGD